jgi:hypothetical protein
MQQLLSLKTRWQSQNVGWHVQHKLLHIKRDVWQRKTRNASFTILLTPLGNKTRCICTVLYVQCLDVHSPGQSLLWVKKVLCGEFKQPVMKFNVEKRVKNLKINNTLWFKAFTAIKFNKIFSGQQNFPDDENRDGRRIVGSLAIQPPEAAASPRIFYWKRTEFQNTVV